MTFLKSWGIPKSLWISIPIILIIHWSMMTMTMRMGYPHDWMETSKNHQFFFVKSHEIPGFLVPSGATSFHIFPPSWQVADQLLLASRDHHQRHRRAALVVEVHALHRALGPSESAEVAGGRWSAMVDVSWEPGSTMPKDFRGFYGRNVAHSIKRWGDCGIAVEYCCTTCTTTCCGLVEGLYLKPWDKVNK